MNQSDPVKVLENSVLIANRQEVEAAVERMAVAINAHYGDQPIILLAVMTGAIMSAAWLASRLKMPLQMDFVHATR
ncbi:MAG: hypoxanthine-guanine phosphoribosyltransferase, partial [Proteobacteria bacterium]|nr:hypoxanthine-guanine phosphoribosyltransferase [Pseudomonadota bacterium]